MAPSSGLWAPIAMKLLRNAFKKTSRIVKLRIAEVTGRPATELQPIFARNTPRHAISRAAWIRQSKGRWYTTHSTVNAAIRRFTSTVQGTSKYDRSAFPTSAVATAVSRLTSRAPFASTLRPNLTGGALPRTAGGYSLGGGRTGGARYFSHTPAAPAQVVNNVSAAVRAFWLSGNKAQFDGLTVRGEKRYRTISTLQDETGKKMQVVPRFAPGSFIDFHVSPTVTALSPLGATFPYSTAMTQESPTLNTDGFFDILSIDFSRALKDLAVIMNDLKKLSALGDLTITLEGQSTLRVRFPGCDAESVERLCDEIGVQRGTIHQDPAFGLSVGTRVALMFPFADTSQHALSSPGGSLRSQTGYDESFEEFENSPWPTSPEGYETMDELSETESMYFKQASHHSSSDYEGMEGIYRFLEECHNARRT